MLFGKKGEKKSAQGVEASGQSREKRSGKKKVLLAGGIVVVLAAGIVLRFMLEEEEPYLRKVPLVRLESLENATVENEISLTGQVKTANTYTIRPKAEGELLEVYVENGDLVTQGQELARIDNHKQVEEAKYAVEQAEAARESAVNARNRMLPLYQSGDVSAQEYEEVRTQATAAEAELKTARLAYETAREYSVVTAPADGRVERLVKSLNTWASAETELCVLLGSGAKNLEFGVTEDLLETLSVSDSVTVEKNRKQYAGRISEISSVPEEETGLYMVKAELKEAESLANGTVVKLNLIAEKAENVPTVALSTLFYSGGSPYVYVYEEGTAVRREIVLGVQDQDRAEVISGLTSEDQIIGNWSKELYDGAIVTTDPESVLAEG